MSSLEPLAMGGAPGARRWRTFGQTRDWRAFLALLGNLTARNLKVKYQRSFLGVLWTLLNPLATTLTLIIVFGSVVRLPVEDYWAFLLSGFFVWNFVNMTVSTGGYVLAQNAAVMRAARVPAEAFVLAAMAARLLEFVVELGLVLLVLALFHHQAVPASYAAVPVLIVAQVLLATGILLPIAMLAAFYDDVHHSLPIVFLILFYLSPVFYPESLVPAGMAGVYRLNPMAGLLRLYHEVLYQGRLPELAAVLLMLGVGLLLTIAGLLVFRRFRPLLPEVL